MRLSLIVGLALALGACSRSAPPPTDSGKPPATGFEPPVALNAEPPVRYPVALYEAHTEGTVVLHLFVDSTGKAALAGVPNMRFAPARKDGVPVATAFLQPVHFRHPSGTSMGDGS